MILISYAGRKTKIDVDIETHVFGLGAGLASVTIDLLWMRGGGCVLVDMVLVSGAWVGYDYEWRRRRRTDSSSGRWR